MKFRLEIEKNWVPRLKLELPSFPLGVGKNREENDLNELDDKVRSSSLRNIHFALPENSMPQEIIVIIIPATHPTKWWTSQKFIEIHEPWDKPINLRFLLQCAANVFWYPGPLDKRWIRSASFLFRLCFGWFSKVMRRISLHSSDANMRIWNHDGQLCP